MKQYFTTLKPLALTPITAVSILLYVCNNI